MKNQLYKTTIIYAWSFIKDNIPLLNENPLFIKALELEKTDESGIIYVSPESRDHYINIVDELMFSATSFHNEKLRKNQNKIFYILSSDDVE